MTEKIPEAAFRHIVRVANVDLPGEEPLHWALTKIKGIGINYADSVCAAANISRKIKAGHLSEAEVVRLNKVLLQPEGILPVWLYNRRKDYETGEDKHILMGTLDFTLDNDLKRLKKIKSYRGLRHQKGLPVRGQRTRSNFRKSKGKVVGVSKKKVAPAAEEKGGKKEKKQ